MSRKRQRPIKGARGPRPTLSASLMAAIEHEVGWRARKFRVSRSFVIAVALADAFNVDGQEQYLDPDTPHN